MRIESIADHLDRIETIARWHWSEWGIYRRLGWEPVARSRYEGSRVVVMRHATPRAEDLQ